MKSPVFYCMLISVAMICACQKQDSTAEAQLAQRKAELDTREKALAEREKALVEREKPIARSRPLPSERQSRRPAVDPEQVKAAREKRIQQLPPELRALIIDRSLLDARTAEKDGATGDGTERLRRLEEERSKKMSAIATPNADSSEAQPSSPSPSPTPE